MKKSLHRFSLLVLALSVFAGGGSLVAYAATTTNAVTSATDIVVPGGVNATQFDITVDVSANDLQDLYLIASNNVDFTAITADTSYATRDFRTVDALPIGSTGLTLSFPDGSPQDYFYTQEYFLAYAPQMTAGNTFSINTNNYPAQNSHIKLSLSPGAMTFAGTGPWEIQVLAFYTGGGAQSTTWPPLQSEYKTITLTEPVSPTPTPTPTPIPAQSTTVSDSGNLAATGVNPNFGIALVIIALASGTAIVALGVLGTKRKTRVHAKNKP